MALIMRNPLQNLAYRLTMSSDNRHKPPYIPTTTDILGLWRVPERTFQLCSNHCVILALRDPVM